MIFFEIEWKFGVAEMDALIITALCKLKFMMITVFKTFKVANGPNNGADDFLNTSGVVTFEQGQRIANLSIQLNPDNVRNSK